MSSGTSVVSGRLALKDSTCAEPHELSIVLCDDEYMTAVNNEWRGQNRPTDVLSFEIPHDEFTAV